MKNLILFFLSLNLVFAQQESSARSLTIYKDSFAVIKEPIVWSLKSGKNITSFTNISKNILFDSPVLSLQGVDVLSQNLNKNYTKTENYLRQ